MARPVRPRDSLALLAALLTALAPVLAHAHLALAAQSGYAEVCTARGLARVPTGDGWQGDGGLGAALAHCAVCVSAGGDQAFTGGAPRTFIVDPDAAPIVAGADRGASADPVRASRARGPPRSPAAVG